MSTNQKTLKRRGIRMFATVAGVAASLAVMTPAANAQVSAMDESGCNNGICVTARGSGGYVSNTYASISSLSPFLSFYGHYRVFGPDYSVNSETRTWSTSWVFNVPVGRSYGDGQLHCSEAWRQNSDGSHTLLGRPCVANPI